MAVLLTGAAGRIGMMLRERLPALGWDLRLLDRVAVDGGLVGEASDPAAWDAALSEPTDAIVHLGGQPGEAPWPVVRDSNIEGVFQMFEAARRHGVRRVVFASSNHATGFTPMSDDLPADAEARPDTLYGVSKVFGEALGRYYSDRYRIAVAVLRIGTCTPVPPDVRALSTWLSPDDCARLVDAALRAADLTYEVVWGVSANTRRRWRLDEALGYAPVDDAERHAVGLVAHEADHLVGGTFTTAAFGIDEVAGRA